MVRGRFAPSPTGRMHVGNIWAALLSWLSCKSRRGEWLLRIEDLDPQRSKLAYALQAEDDLRWLGLHWDIGGTEQRCMQSLRGDIYREHLDRLNAMSLTYPCYCSRADIMATQAPHESDGRVVYKGTCRTARMVPGRAPATRLIVSDEIIDFVDRVYGPQAVNLSVHCGDFVIRRADGAWAYQLAVVVDDALMGVTEVVRGRDLLLSSAQQIYLYRLLGYAVPEFAHFPLLCNADGLRLSKRDKSLDMGELRKRFSPEQLLYRLATVAHWLPYSQDEARVGISLNELLCIYREAALPTSNILLKEPLLEHP